MPKFKTGLATLIVVLCGVIGVAVGAAILVNIENHGHSHQDFRHEHVHNHGKHGDPYHDHIHSHQCPTLEEE